MISRRQWLGGSISGFFAYLLRNQSSFLNRANHRQSGPAKRCIVLWMEGGPSQLDTFDPKPGKVTGGPVKSIGTSAIGIEISEYLPAVAQQMHHMSVIRNLSSDEGEHVRAQHYLHTGFKFVPSFPRPSMGSVISAQSDQGDIPNYVALGSPGFGPAYMGPVNAPFAVQNLEQAGKLLNKIRRRANQLDLLNQLDLPFSSRIIDERVAQRRANIEKIERLSQTRFAQALDVRSFSKRDQARYGNTEFGRHCLVARKLLDLGVNFVEVQMAGWDTHTQNFKNVERLCGGIDRPFAALVEDLNNSGMLEDTVVLWMGEFGRTPNINANSGRDHFPRCTPVVIGGGPFQTGLTVGATNELGTSIEGKAYQVADLFATLFSAFGIQPDQEFKTDFDSPTTATNDGKIISELVG